MNINTNRNLHSKTMSIHTHLANPPDDGSGVLVTRGATPSPSRQFCQHCVPPHLEPDPPLQQPRGAVHSVADISRVNSIQNNTLLLIKGGQVRVIYRM